ncbi:restriction endonuclease subunit S, partial [Bifidobacterium adolescentis]|nr:restriction endonuclease subunit S [Bifidobacterium adolescentis]
MAEQHEKALVPQIRFTGFTDPWEQRKLGEVAHFINGRAYSQNELLSSGKYPVLRVGNFYTNDSWYYSNLELEDKNYAYEGDLLYTWSATFGPHIWHGNKVIYHYHIWKVQLEAAFEKLFAFQLLERDKERILSDKNGSTMVHITKIGIENTSVLMPCSVIEQRQIGAFFDRLDSLITLHQRKYDKLCVLKKSMLDKMFPKGGSLYPEIRFAGFTNHWEQRKLGELFEESDERASDREILSVSVANGIYPASESDRETNPGASLANYKVVHSGDVVYNSMRMWQGAVDASRYDGIVSPAYVVAKPNSEVYARFFARLLRQPMLLKQYQQVSQGNSKDTQVLKFDDFASIEISMPASENEQRRIGAFFDRLDSLITLHQRKLEL